MHGCFLAVSSGTVVILDADTELSQVRECCHEAIELPWSKDWEVGVSES
jgi:hypothetical protein